MHAMLLTRHTRLEQDPQPLEPGEMPVPEPGSGEILIQVTACGVCHTELDEIEGRLPPPRLPVIPGHQVIGRVAGMGPAAPDVRTPPAASLHMGERVGVAWISSACGECAQCRAGNENLCANFQRHR